MKSDFRKLVLSTMNAQSTSRLPDLYARLGISPQATQAQIESAYKNLYNLWRHRITAADPRTRDEAKKTIRLLKEAYGVLSNLAMRARYDAVFTLQRASGSSSLPVYTSVQCPHCGFNCSASKTSCPACYQTLQKPCLECRQYISITRNFCGYCGLDQRLAVKSLSDEAKHLYAKASKKIRDYHGLGGWIFLLTLASTIGGGIVLGKWLATSMSDLAWWMYFLCPGLLLAGGSAAILALPPFFAQLGEKRASERNAAISKAREQYQDINLLLKQHNVRVASLPQEKPSRYWWFSSGYMILVGAAIALTYYFYSCLEAEPVVWKRMLTAILTTFTIGLLPLALVYEFVRRYWLDPPSH